MQKLIAVFHRALCSPCTASKLTVIMRKICSRNKTIRPPYKVLWVFYTLIANKQKYQMFPFASFFIMCSNVLLLKMQNLMTWGMGFVEDTVLCSVLDT